MTNRGEGGRTFALWGRITETAFDGSGDGISLDGDVATGFFGSELARGSRLTGLALGLTEAEGTWTPTGWEEGERGAGGGIEVSLVSLSPYGHIRLGGDRTAWGVLGVGRGELTLTPASGPATETDLGWGMAAAGSGPDISLDLTATRSEGGGQEPKHGIGAEVNVRW